MLSVYNLREGVGHEFWFDEIDGTMSRVSDGARGVQMELRISSILEDLELEAIEQYSPSRFSRHDMIFGNYGPLKPMGIVVHQPQMPLQPLALEYLHLPKERNNSYHRGIVQGTRGGALRQPTCFKSSWSLTRDQLNTHEMAARMQRKRRSIPHYDLTRCKNPVVRKFREAIQARMKMSRVELEAKELIEILPPRRMDSESGDEAEFSTIPLPIKGVSKSSSTPQIGIHRGIHNFQMIPI